MPKQASSKAEPSAGKTRKRAVAKSALPSVSEQLAAPRAYSYEEIALRAYGIYIARGADEGGALSDWLQAEHELRAQVG